MSERPYSVTWWDDICVEYDFDFPHWTVGMRTVHLTDLLGAPQHSMDAAIMATCPEDAKRKITEAYEDEVDLEWQFIVEQPYGWIPFSKARPKEPGMIWNQKPH